jgi:two-component system sensor histidine kinase KdpD
MGLHSGRSDANEREDFGPRSAGGASPDASTSTAQAADASEAWRRVAALESSLAAQARTHSDLIHILCHELRTPITVLKGFGRLLQEPTNGELSERQDLFVSEILKACQRLNALVGDLLEASPESGTSLGVDLKVGDLNATIYSMLTSLSPLWANKEIIVEVELDPEVLEVAFDAGRIEQVLTNLLTNAIRYGRRDGRVRVGSVRCEPSPHATNDEVQVYVEDDGPGIPVTDRSRVFEPYVRGDRESDCAGMGIGLAICHRIVQSHGGSIRVEEGSLGGARFVFSLPVVPTSNEEN